MAKTLKEQQAFIGKALGRAKAYKARGQITLTLSADQDTIDLLDAIYGNLKMIEVELAETPSEAKEATQP